MRNTQDLSGYGVERDDEPEVIKLPDCEVGVYSDSEAGCEPCGSPASFKVRWGGGPWLHVCDEHLKEVRPL